MPDDYFCVLPNPVTFWPHKMGIMEPAEGQVPSCSPPPCPAHRRRARAAAASNRCIYCVFLLGSLVWMSACCLQRADHPLPCLGHQVGRIHFAPAIEADTAWTGLRGWVQSTLNSKFEGLDEAANQVRFYSHRPAQPRHSHGTATAQLPQ